MFEFASGRVSGRLAFPGSISVANATPKRFASHHAIVPSTLPTEGMVKISCSLVCTG